MNIVDNFFKYTIAVLAIAIGGAISASKVKPEDILGAGIACAGLAIATAIMISREEKK